MELTTILGLVAGTFTTVAFLPQAVKTWRTRSAKDLSLNMFLIFCLGVLLWLIYGILKSDLAIILSNILTLLMATSILFFKIRYKD